MNRRHSREQGAALLIMMLVVLAATTAILVSRINGANLAAARHTESSAALSEARDALLAFAATEPDRMPGAPARLPCPDLDSSGGFAEGEAHTTACGATSVSVLGRLPWRTLGLPATKDAAKACLWYAVSGDYKSADTGSAALLNPDTAGQFRLYDDSGALLDGVLPADRPVALIFAPGGALSGQGRNATDTTGCSSSVDPADYLDAATALSIDNAALLGTPDAIDDFVTTRVASDTLNDRVMVIRQSDLAAVAIDRHDYLTEAATLGRSVAECVAEYGRNNSGGSDDRRLPWPAPLALADYRADAAYDDADLGVFAGRVPDAVADSSAATSNSQSQVLSACSAAAVPTWTWPMQSRWRNLKDHFFYVVADSFAPGSSVPSTCSDCMTVNGSGQYVGVILFAGPALAAQARTMPPNDPDTRSNVSNYLEGANAAAFPYTGGPLDLASGAQTAGFNDLLFCIAPDLTVTSC